MIFAIEPPEELRHLGGSFEPMWSVLDELDGQYKQGRILPKGEYLHLFLLAVDHRESGKNVAKNLVQTCLECAFKQTTEMFHRVYNRSLL